MPLKFSGIQQFTMLDYPDKVACVAFTPGCTMRCAYCHNPEFVLPLQIQKIKDTFVSEDTFFSFLKKRQGLLEGVVISGGEPTMWHALPAFIAKTKALGFLVKLDTNGTNFNMLRVVVESGGVDYVAMDVKTSFPAYADLGLKSRLLQKNVEASAALLLEEKVDYEFRATLVKELHSEKTLKSMAKQVDGARRLFLQTFRTTRVLDKRAESWHAFTEKEMRHIADNIFASHCQTVAIRE